MRVSVSVSVKEYEDKAKREINCKIDLYHFSSKNMWLIILNGKIISYAKQLNEFSVSQKTPFEIVKILLQLCSFCYYSSRDRHTDNCYLIVVKLYVHVYLNAFHYVMLLR